MKISISFAPLGRAFSRLSGFVAFLATCTIGTHCAAATVTLLDVTGAGNTYQGIVNGQALATAFSIDHSITGAELSADIICVDACDGNVFLMKNNVGPSSTIADLVGVRSLSLATANDPLLSGLTLGPGLYYLVIALTGNGLGNLGWISSDPATITESMGVVYGSDMRSDKIDFGLPFVSEFSIIAQASAMHFRLTADGDRPDPSAVPLPAGALLLATGLLGLGLTRRRKT